MKEHFNSLFACALLIASVLLPTPVLAEYRAVRLFGPEIVPVPDAYRPAVVDTVYSPSLARDSAGNLVMAFGVGILCNGGQAYTDSIALARTS